tara:strand:+ start:165 stop:533 length:369 start_codon:yes stop_codon:yes gene_type:complete
VSDKSVNGTEEVTCPYCGHEQSDSWEVSSGKGMHDCEGCERVFYAEDEIHRTFNSWTEEAELENRIYNNKRRVSMAERSIERCKEAGEEPLDFDLKCLELYSKALESTQKELEELRSKHGTH